jgi:copper ion binding protein
MAETTYHVPGITCGHCRSAIETEVGALDGVESVVVDIDSRQVAVVGSADDDTIRAAIVEAGYEADPAG